MSQTDSSDSSDNSKMTSSSQDSEYGTSRESKLPSQEVEDAANWRARQLLNITEEPEETESRHKLVEIKGKTVDLAQHDFRITKFPGLINVQGKKNDEIIKK